MHCTRTVEETERKGEGDTHAQHTCTCLYAENLCHARLSRHVSLASAFNRLLTTPGANALPLLMLGSSNVVNLLVVLSSQCCERGGRWRGVAFINF